MDTAEALKVIQALADGADPNTGEIFPEESAYQHPKVIRALLAAAKALELQERNERRRDHLPARAGQSWDEAEDKRLLGEFEAGTSIAQLARRHGRTEGAIPSRLEKLGKLQPNPQGRSE